MCIIMFIWYSSLITLSCSVSSPLFTCCVYLSRVSIWNLSRPVLCTWYDVYTLWWRAVLGSRLTLSILAECPKGSLILVVGHFCIALFSTGNWLIVLYTFIQFMSITILEKRRRLEYVVCTNCSLVTNSAVCFLLRKEH